MALGYLGYIEINNADSPLYIFDITRDEKDVDHPAKQITPFIVFFEDVQVVSLESLAE